MTASAIDHRPDVRRGLWWGQWPVLKRSLADHQRSLVSWGLGIGTYLGLIVAVWPSIRGSSEIAKAIENYPDALKDFFGGAAAFDYTKPGGFLNTQLFSLILPLLLSGFAIGYGASTVAGEEHSGQLDLVLALPLARSRIIAEKVAALVLSVSALTAVCTAVMLGVGGLVNLDIPATNIVAACTGSGLVALLCGLSALAIGAGTGNRALALGVSAALFTAGYLLQALSGLVNAIRPARIISPLYHANDSVPINNGFPTWHYGVLAALCALLAIAAVLLFQRRDVNS